MIYGIAYTEDGLPPGSNVGGKIVRWKQDEGVVMTWEDNGDALLMCDLDGWRGYVCEYPSGAYMQER